MFFVHAGILLFSFYALARLIDLYFVETLEIISKKLKLSSDVAGATFMTIGSSAPELFVSILALTKISEQQTLGAGTIVGSAIFNILVIIGASALYRRALLTWQPVMRDLTFYMLTILALLFTFRDGAITFGDALIFSGIYCLYLWSLSFWKKWFPYRSKDDRLDIVESDNDSQRAQIAKKAWGVKTVFDKLMTYAFFDLDRRPQFYLVNFVLAVSGLALLSHFMVESAIGLAEYLKIPSTIIGLPLKPPTPFSLPSPPQPLTIGAVMPLTLEALTPGAVLRARRIVLPLAVPTKQLLV